MITETVRLAKKNLDSPDVTRDCGHGKLELVTLEDTTVARATLLPGWKWSEHIRPLAPRKAAKCSISSTSSAAACGSCKRMARNWTWDRATSPPFQPVTMAG